MATTKQRQEEAETRSEADTSARLLEAAPALLAALEALLEHTPVPRVKMGEVFDDPFPLPDYIKQAYAAVKLAKG